MKTARVSNSFFLRGWLWLIVAASAILAGRSAEALNVSPITSDNGYPAHRVQWTDAAGLQRWAVLVDQNANGAGPFTGYLRQYTYQVNGTTRTCTGTTNYAAGGNLEFSGDGFVQNHTGNGGDFSSGNGAGVPGTTTVTLQGPSHAIITFSMPAYKISGKTVPTTVQWFFADGRSHPVFAVSQDARALTGNLGADSRTPYGDMAYDGDGVDALVGGFSWGDTFKMVTLAANPEQVTQQTGWRATEANKIPYAMQWAESARVDAEMGHVATLPITIYDQGADTQSYPNVFDPRNKYQPGGPLPAAETWAYQIINYSLAANGPTDSKRLAWQTNFGRVGGFDNYGDSSLNVIQYSQHSTDPVDHPLEGLRADGSFMAYSTFIALGSHQGGYLNGTVGQTVQQMENAAASTLSATTGTVVAHGPAGVGSVANATISYTPAGYNPTYSTWEITASQNAVNATLTPPAGKVLDHPVFVVRGYTLTQLPLSISINGQSAPNTNYFATLDTAGQRLWITVNQASSQALNLVVTPPGAGSQAPVITSELNPPSRQGVAFGYQITATNSPTSYAASSLPSGLTISTSTGRISGRPSVYGTFQVPISATNNGGTGTATLNLVVKQAIPVITSDLNPPSRQGVSFGYQITATNNPTSYAASGLPAGLTINTATGRISGRPTVYGTFNVAIKASNSGGYGTATLNLVVKQAIPVITSDLNPPSRQGVAFGYQITATNNPTSFAAGGLPPGLTISTSTGRITGHPTQAGTYNVAIKATNSGGSGAATLNLVVKPPA